MKKYLGWLIGIIIVLGLIIGEEVKHRMDQQKQLQQEMVKIVKSEEVQKLFENELKYLDPQALTEDGLIKTYEIDYDSFNKNPMGGFSVKLIINKVPELYLRVRLGKYNNVGTIEISSTHESSQLLELIESK